MLYAMPEKWTAERLRQLGTLVRRTRGALGLSVDAAASRAGMSPVTWARVESGNTVRTLTYAGVERVLRWRLGAIEDFLTDGVEPAAAEEPSSRARDLVEAVARDVGGILDDPQLSEADRYEIAQLVMDAWQREEEQSRRRRIEQAQTITQTYKRGRGVA